MQAVWQQAVGVPQCQMRFGSNEKVTIIMVAGMLSSLTVPSSREFTHWATLDLHASGPLKAISSSVVLAEAALPTDLSNLSRLPAHIASSSEGRGVYHADPGSFSGTAEAAYYRRAVQNSIELPANISTCADYVTGTIMGQPVVVITSGKVVDAQLRSPM